MQSKGFQGALEKMAESTKNGTVLFYRQLPSRNENPLIILREGQLSSIIILIYNE